MTQDNVDKILLIESGIKPKIKIKIKISKFGQYAFSNITYTRCVLFLISTAIILGPDVVFVSVVCRLSSACNVMIEVHDRVSFSFYI